MISHTKPHERDPIAIIGIGCRFPGSASTPDKLWELLCAGFDGIVDVPKDRWDLRRFYHPDSAYAGKMNVNKGGFLKEPIDQFDADFFNISPREADNVDPQQRLLLEVSWEALEDAGLVPSSLEGSKTGVFIGGFTMDWSALNSSPFNRLLINPYTSLNSTQTILAAKLAYYYDFKGPCLTTDTACSASMVSFHLACQSLWNDECTMALAGGVNVMLTPEATIGMSKGHFLSPLGQCRPFDAEALGYARAEGAGIVILKPLNLALRDGDPIYALVRGTGINHDGRTQGIALPNRESQRVLIAETLAKAKVLPEDVQYVEAHGTGTAVGDPAEAWSLNEVFSIEGRKKCLIGSIKSNFGHLEAAAGIAGIIKATLCLKHRRIPPQLHFDNPNPAIPFNQYCLQVSDHLQDFPDPEKKLFVGVNSFGYGGTNAHVVMEEYSNLECGDLSPLFPQTLIVEKAEKSHRTSNLVLPITAKNTEALKEHVRQVVSYLQANPSVSFANLASAFYFHREHHSHRAYVIADSTTQLTHNLQSYLDHGPGRYVVEGVRAEASPKIAFVYTGMGPQWHGMGKELFQQESVFRATLESCDLYLKEIAGWSLLEELQRDEQTSKMSDAKIAQPANFALQAALTELLKDWGIMPEAVVGHSIGEVGAAYAAGAITLKEGMLISYHRSRLQATRQELGSMLAAELSEEQAIGIITKQSLPLSIGAINSSTSLTLSGDVKALTKASVSIEKLGGFYRFLQVKIAYHSHQMEGLEPELIQSLSSLSPVQPTIPFFSTVTGLREQTLPLNSSYWWKNVRQPVLFHKAFSNMLTSGFRVFVEIGPHPVLSRAMQETFQLLKHKGAVLYSLHRAESERESLARLVARLNLAGVSIDWRKFLTETVYNLSALPKYPWQKKRAWMESEESLQYRLSLKEHVMLSLRNQSPQDSWRVEINQLFFPWLEDHCVDEAIVFPASVYVEAGLALQRHLHGDLVCVLEDLKFLKPLVVGPHIEPLLYVSSDPTPSSFSVHSLSNQLEGSWTLHATGKLSRPWKGYQPEKVALVDIKARSFEEVSHKKIYEILAGYGLNYGPQFQLIQNLYRQPSAALSVIENSDQEDWILSPVLLDAGFQTLLGAKHPIYFDGNPLPVSIDRIHFFCKPKGKVYWYAKETFISTEVIEGDIYLCDEEGNICVEVRHAVFRILTSSRMNLKANVDKLAYQIVQEKMPIALDTSPKKDFLKDQQWCIVGNDPGYQTVLKKYGAFCQNRSQACDLRFEESSNINARSAQITNHKPDTVFNKDGNFLLLGDSQSQAGASNDLTLELFRLVQSLATSEYRHTIWCRINSPQEAGLQGLAAVIRQELPHIQVNFFQALNPLEFLKVLTLKLPYVDATIRPDGVYFSKIKRCQYGVDTEQDACLLQSNVEAFQLETHSEGSIDRLFFRKLESKTLESGQIRVRVNTAAVNFKDYVKLLGRFDKKMLEGTYFGAGLGMECAGTIEAVGADVHDLKIGQQVYAATPNAFSSVITVSTDAVWEIPPQVSFEEAPMYIPFMTALYCLRNIANLKKDETILIHSAAGSVGLAAIQYAHSIGAKVIATTGTEEKRKYLESLGIQCVADSRSLQFVDQVILWTNGKGVDVVLNSLLGEFLLKSWSLLAPCGRFVEIGKQDINQNTPLPMEVFNRNASFIAVDLDRLFADDIQCIRKLAFDVLECFDKGIFKPIPSQMFPISKVSEAFQFFAKGLHIGRVMLKFTNEVINAKNLRLDSTLFNSHSTYLISGGLSGLGLATARWIVEKGGNHLILLGRRGASPEAQEEIQDLEQRGAQIVVVSVDVGDFTVLESALSNLPVNLPPLKGVFHSAMVLDDDLLINLDAERFKSVLHPKIAGCLNLHELTKQMNLDYFVLYSSISSLIGNPGQGNYAAANAFLDAFAIYRKNLGLPGLSINWGAISSVGSSRMLTAHFETMGIKPIAPRVGLQVLEYLIRQGSSDQGRLAIMDVDWNKLLNHFTQLQQEALFSNLLESLETKGEVSLQSYLLSLDEEKRVAAIADFIQNKLATILKMGAKEIDVKKKLGSFGMDSLMLMELQASFEQDLNVKIPLIELIKSPMISDLTNTINSIISSSE